MTSAEYQPQEPQDSVQLVAETVAADSFAQQPGTLEAAQEIGSATPTHRSDEEPHITRMGDVIG